MPACELTSARDGDGLAHGGGGDGQVLDVDDGGEDREGGLEGGEGRGRRGGGGVFGFGFEVGDFFFEHGNVVAPVAAHVGAAEEQHVGVHVAGLGKGLPVFEGVLLVDDGLAQGGGVARAAVEAVGDGGGDAVGVELGEFGLHQ